MKPDIEDRPAALPKSRITHRRWSFSWVWIVPLIAAVIAAYVTYDYFHRLGPKITIAFKDGNGLKAGQTEIKYRGVPVGQVLAVELTHDGQQVSVVARLRRSDSEIIARQGSVFWIVRPEVGLGSVTGLATVITGPEMQVLPGTGSPTLEFVGADNPPLEPEIKGLRLVLRANHLGSIKRNAPLYYRGIEVGAVQSTELTADSTAVNIRAVVKQRYANLVRSGSKFWMVSGAEIHAGLFSGIDVKVESLQSLVAGGIAFATPDDPQDKPAKNGAIFAVFEKAEKDWPFWTPNIPISPAKE